PMQHERAGFTSRTEHPGVLAGTGFDDVVIAAHVLAVPPAAFDAFGTGEDSPHRGAQRDRPVQQPGRTRMPGRFVRTWFAVFDLPCTFGTMVRAQCDPVHRLVAEPRTQAF